MLSGNNGVLQRATDAKTKSNEAQIRERIQLAYHSALTGGQGSYTYDTLMKELENEFKTDYDVDDSDNTNWTLYAHGQSVTIPAGESNEEEIDLSVDTTWQQVFVMPTYGNYIRYTLDNENETLTLRTGPTLTEKNIEIKKYAVIEGKKYETKFPDSCAGLFYGSRMENFSIEKEIDFSNVTNMSGMFSGCDCVSTLNLGNLDVSNVTDMGSLFSGCYKLSDLDVSNWNTNKVTNMQGMFKNCYSITRLDLSSWDTSNVTKMGKMFCMDASNEYDAKLQTIYASNTFVVTKVNDVINSSDRNGGNLFGNTKNLVGGNGTSYTDILSNNDVNNLIAIYGARIDTTETPGFFTAKP